MPVELVINLKETTQSSGMTWITFSAHLKLWGADLGAIGSNENFLID